MINLTISPTPPLLDLCRLRQLYDSDLPNSCLDSVLDKVLGKNNVHRYEIDCVLDRPRHNLPKPDDDTLGGLMDVVIKDEISAILLAEEYLTEIGKDVREEWNAIRERERITGEQS